MADLHWFPFYPTDWLSSPAVQIMNAEQRGAFIQLLALAWGDGSERPSLPADDRALSVLSGMGVRWKKLGAVVLEQFSKIDGRIYNAKLSEIWDESQTKHGKAVERGQKSAKARADKRQKISKVSEDLLQQLQPQPQLQDELERGAKAPSVLASSALVGALAPEGARSIAPNGSNGVWRSESPADPATMQLEGEYAKRLVERVDQWAIDNPDDAIELDSLLRSEMGLPVNRDLSEFQKLSMRERFLSRVRQRNRWPDCEQWIVLERARAAELPPGNADRAANDVSTEAAA